MRAKQAIVVTVVLGVLSMAAPAAAAPAGPRCNPEFEAACQVLREVCRATGKCVI